MLNKFGDVEVLSKFESRNSSATSHATAMISGTSGTDTRHLSGPTAVHKSRLQPCQGRRIMQSGIRFEPTWCAVDAAGSSSSLLGCIVLPSTFAPVASASRPQVCDDAEQGT